MVRPTSSSDGDEGGLTPLVAACEAGHMGVVKYLLETEGVDPEQAARDGTTPLLAAALKGHLKIVKYLTEKGISPVQLKEIHGTTLIHAAAKSGNIKLLEHLIDELRVNPEEKDENGATPLDHARNDKVRTLLLSRGAHASKSDRSRRRTSTPSRYSVGEENYSQVFVKTLCTNE